MLTEPWITSIDLSGNPVQEGILATLKNAHKIDSIFDPAPPVEFGIYRLLIAFITDVFQPQGLEDLADLLDRKRLDPTALDEYAARWRDRFDLFDEKYPFLQQAITGVIKKPPEPISRLMQHLPAGTNVSHFHHGRWDENSFSFEQCAKGLVTIAPFMTAGGAGLSPSINGSPPWYVLVKGNNLFETLLYNVCQIPMTVKPIGDSPVAWRNDKRIDPGDEPKTFSIVEGLTWRPRIIQLIPGNGKGTCTYTGEKDVDTVSHMHYYPGQKSPEPGLWVDPQVAYKKTKDAIRPLRPDENKALWRDIGPLMLLQHGDYSGKDGKVSFDRPAVVTQYKQMVSNGMIKRSEPLRLEVYGIRTDGKMKIYEWYHEKLALPIEILKKANSGRQIQDAMDLADSVAYILRKAMKKAYPRNAKSNESGFDNLILSVQSSYWSHLKGQFESIFLKTLSQQDENDLDAYTKLMEQWKKILDDTGKNALDKGLGPLDTDGDSLRRQVKAMNEYSSGIRFALYPDSIQAKKKNRQKNKEDK
ncbi:type I-E CRISPR-associated protein Cse1/CasA [Methanocella arvoryzae]|uniref:type I-E CRISPR-associated protein Cse1/CasA n=1 Tax=Methanocella arvoryzae TaxID=1175445 RepID=UPI0013051BBC|nr:type I-E CRISPR-associated protein Cse1/CasA [Methanocella arvoryzae]